MKSKIISMFFIFNCYQGLCQDTSYVKYKVFIDDSIVLDKNENNKKEFSDDSLVNVLFDDTEFCITFNGGEKALRKFVEKKLVLKKEDFIVGGKVIASFTVNENGKVENVKIEKGVNENIDKEVIRVLSEMPDWKWNCEQRPRRHILIKRYFPISFALTKDK